MKPSSVSRYAFLTDPTPDDLRRIVSLYFEAGWLPSRAENPDLISRIISGSHCFVTAAADCRIIGMGRAISDGVSDAYIQDVTVDAAYRGQGIGTKIIRKLVGRLREDGVAWIGLIAERNSHDFYRPLGFKKMPDAIPMLMTIP